MVIWVSELAFFLFLNAAFTILANLQAEEDIAKQ